MNSITALAENKNYTSSETKMVVDYYDLDGKYVKSEIVHSKFSKSHITMVEDGDDRKKSFRSHQPLSSLMTIYKIFDPVLYQMTIKNRLNNIY